MAELPICEGKFAKIEIEIMKLLIPVFQNAVTSSVVGVMDILSHSRAFRNSFMPERASESMFDVMLVAVGNELTVENFGFPVKCHTLLDEAPQADLIVVPAAVGNMPELLAQNEEFIKWLLSQHAGGATLCSTCTGAFFVAKTGLLNGKEATTSWFAADAFRKIFPEVLLLDERVIVDNGHIISSGATLSYINLCIYLIEKYFGKALANYVAKMFLVDKGKGSQQSFAMFNAQKEHNDQEIRDLQNYIEAKCESKITVSHVAQQASMSERSFIRRFKQATGNTPSEYIQRVKVELAKKMLEEGRENIKEISYRTGYEDLSFFRDLFKRHTGLTPIEYRKMYCFA